MPFALFFNPLKQGLHILSAETRRLIDSFDKLEENATFSYRFSKNLHQDFLLIALVMIDKNATGFNCFLLASGTVEVRNKLQFLGTSGALGRTLIERKDER